MKITKISAGIISAVMFTLACIIPAGAADSNSDIFFDDFSGDSLDYGKWLAAHKNWGGKIEENGEMVDYNGGVIPENISVTDGKLILTGCGNYYDGNIRGINRDGSQRSDGRRVGAAIATREYFASGSYEISAKLAPELGACSAMWTFEYEEDYSNDSLKITNHEIDIEFPGRSSESSDDYNFSSALCTTWIGENSGEYFTNYTDLGKNYADGEFHKFRFDWHTGDPEKNEEARVEFYFDDVLVHTSYDYIPTNAGRLWLGLWFPRYWAGTPDFDTAAFEIDYIRITPFHESGDTPENESYPDDGWADIPQVDGDVNLDGKFTIADAVMMQKRIHNNSRLKNWYAGDFDENGCINILDLCLMKNRLFAEK